MEGELEGHPLSVTCLCRSEKEANVSLKSSLGSHLSITQYVKDVPTMFSWVHPLIYQRYGLQSERNCARGQQSCSSPRVDCTEMRVKAESIRI